MILMGDGVVANVVLDKTKGHAGGWMVVTTAWALAVFVGVVVAAPYSGAHPNPAVTFAFALTGQFPLERVLPYVSAQMIGAALGAVLVWLAYRPHFEATPDPRTKLAVFCTAPEIRRTGWNFLTELIGTFSLLFIIFYITVGEITLSDNISTLPVGLGSVGALPVAFTVWLSAFRWAVRRAMRSILPETWRRALSMPCCRSEARAEATGAMRGFRSRHLCAARRWQRGFIICFCSRLPGCAAFSV